MMKLVMCIGLAFSCAFAFKNTDDFINEINSKQNLWTAGRNFDKNTPASRISSLLGAQSLPQSVLDTIPLMEHDIDDTDVPESFDSRTHWSNCKSINEITDQSACGSCWAVSVASAITNRICIHSDGKQQPEISAKHLLACTRGNGCRGGYTYYAWLYWKDDGLVTGGPYGSKIGCQPYPFAECEHHTNGSKPACIGTYTTPKCIKECDDSTINFNNDIIHGASAYRISSNERQIQEEIMKNGPVVASFYVYDDFMHYKSGVYVQTEGTLEGRHAVRVIGWGVENNVKFWLVTNSWNEDWGDKGLFKISRGTDECGFESEITAGLPK